MSGAETNAFLTDLAVTKKVSASTQTQALCALLFLYKHVLGQEADWIELAVRAQRPKLQRHNILGGYAALRYHVSAHYPLDHTCATAATSSAKSNYTKRSRVGLAHQSQYPGLDKRPKRS